ncbi:MAG TPA: glycosyltransferase family 4 protein [Bryobacteraceae bacterium]|nr:glycosyltransferase family 4 protein [Bryobacteraceae bacterium]
MILYTAAHGGFREAAPLGGGAAICDLLVDEWSRTRPFEFQLIRPDATAREIVSFSESQYANFSRAFEKKATEEILRHDPKTTTVLVNDVSEGPDFRAIKDYHVFTIYHVDVVAYVADIYFNGWIRPETTVKLYRRLGWALPPISKLVWEKQEASVRYSRGLIMPSEGMKETMLRCYPECPSEKIHVMPWGAADPGPAGDAASLRHEFGIAENARVLLTLSRISPEKGQDLLLEALIEWERREDYPREPLWLFICGDAAFMQGVKFLKRLRTLAMRLQKTRVIFPGYVTGDRKGAFFALADLYIFPSRHESYGLTLIEALAAGVPAVCLNHHGARDVIREEFGEIVQPEDLIAAIARLLKSDLHPMRAAAREFAAKNRFSDRAAELARLIG